MTSASFPDFSLMCPLISTHVIWMCTKDKPREQRYRWECDLGALICGLIILMCSSVLSCISCFNLKALCLYGIDLINTERIIAENLREEKKRPCII